MSTKPPHWRQIKQDTKDRQNARIPNEWRLPAETIAKYQANIDQVVKNAPRYNPVEFLETTELLNAEERAITEIATAEELLKCIRSGKWTSEKVTRAFCHRAALAHQLTNCCTEFFLDKAIEHAKQLDTEEKQGKLRGPLHGLPISLKDQFKVAGEYASIGYFAWAHSNPVEEGDESDIVVCLRNLGAVFYCKTNIPQSLLAWDGYNPLFDRALNPHNTNLIPGGSSAGEGALIALRGSILGVGSDIGGSIRLPSNFCGISGFKPTTMRLPGHNCAATGKGQILVNATIGPMGVSATDLKLFVKSVLDTHPADKDPILTVPVDFRTVKLPKKLRIGYFESLELIKAQPPVRRAVEMTVEKLKAAGHELIPYTPIDPEEALHLLFAAFTQDGGADIKNTLALTGEPYAPSIGDTLKISLIPRIARGLIAKALRLATGDTLVPSILSTALGEFTGAEIDLLNRKVFDYRLRFLNDWNKHAFDAVICPVNPAVAPPHAAITEIVQAFVYTGIWNLVDYPAGVIPVTTVGSQDLKDGYPEGVQMSNGVDKAVRKWWEQSHDEYQGLPICVQVVGKRWEDEKCLAVMQVVEKCLA